MSEKVMFEGKSMWACLHRPNTKFDPKWCIDLIVDEKGEEVASKLGLKVHEKDGNKLLRFKRNVSRRDGTDNKAPIVVDAKKNLTDVLIGNGSLVKVLVRPFSYDFAGKKGVSADLEAVQILELVEFGDSVAFDVEDGFVAEAGVKEVKEKKEDNPVDSLDF